ncbi:MAG TPA: barstar family protein [Acidimicrobiales bacterium]|jgi:hypothetical protein|nr:barstar family protein [Acidimicrobiales bacterium]
MPSFDPGADDWGRDWFLIRDGFVRLILSPDVFGEAIDYLVESGYNVIERDASSWRTTADCLDSLSEALDLPMTGQSLDGFNDWMRSVALYEFGANANDTGTVLALRRYDRFAVRETRTARIVLEIFADCARVGSLVGHRMLCLLQSDDADLYFEPVGATPVSWHRGKRQEARPDPDD